MVLVAIAGVGLALTFQWLRPSPAAAPSPPATTVAIGVAAQVPKTALSSPYLQRVIRTSSDTSVAAAARHAAAHLPRPGHSGLAPGHPPAQQPVAAAQTQTSTTTQTRTVRQDPPWPPLRRWVPKHLPTLSIRTHRWAPRDLTSSHCAVRCAQHRLRTHCVHDRTGPRHGHRDPRRQCDRPLHRGTYLAMTGATVVAVNLDSGCRPAVGLRQPGHFGYYQAMDLPFRALPRTHRTVRLRDHVLATAVLPDTAGAVVFGTSAGCNPGDAAVCDTHLFTAEVPQLLTVSGTVRHRSGAAVPNVVGAPSAMTSRRSTRRDHESQRGLCPAVTRRRVHAADAERRQRGRSTRCTQRAGLRDLVLLDPPAPPRRSRLTWATDK